MTHLSPNFVKPVMPHHSMTLSRHQDKLLQTPATLETFGSTSAVPLHRLEAWKAACVNSWIHRHGPACGKEFVSELSCRNHACRTTAEPATTLSARILSLPRQANRELLAINSKKDRSWLQTRSQNLISEMKPFLASPNETIEAASQKLKLKMASVERDTNCPNRKEMPRRQKKDLPMNVPANPSTDARTTEVYVSIKFHSSTSEARDSLHASSCQNQRSYTVFSKSFWHWGGTVISLQNHNIFRSLTWIQYQCWYKHKRKKSNAPVCDQSKRLLVCTTSNIKIPGARGYTSSKDEI